MRIMLTGSSGMIGTRLFEELLQVVKELVKYVLNVKDKIDDLELTQKGVYRISLPPLGYHNIRQKC